MAELHKDQQPADGIHVSIRWREPDAAARDAIAVTDLDVGGFLLQNDIPALFVLLSATPVMWQQLADSAALIAALDSKADQSDLDATNAALAEKADASDTADALATKADAAATTAALATKADDAATTAALNSKADAAATTAALATKADASAVTASLATKADLALADNPQAGSYTLTSAAPTQLTRMNSASANDLTVPPDAAAIPLRQPMAILRAGTGITTIKAGVGVTLRPANNLRLVTQWDTATVMKIGSNEYLVKGEVTV